MKEAFQAAFRSTLDLDGVGEEITYTSRSNPSDPAKLAAVVSRLSPDDNPVSGMVSTRFQVDFMLSDLKGAGSGAAYTPARQDKITRADGSELVVTEPEKEWGVCSLLAEQRRRPQPMR